MLSSICTKGSQCLGGQSILDTWGAVEEGLLLTGRTCFISIIHRMLQKPERNSFQESYLLRVGFSSFTGVTSTEMVLSISCFPSDSWMEKSSARLSESSCTYVSLSPGRRKTEVSLSCDGAIPTHHK